MKKIFVLLFVVLCSALVSAPVQAQEKPCVTGNLSLDSKMMFHPVEGNTVSYGYTSSMNVEWKNMQFGVGFDNGVKSKWMEAYNFYLFARVGYRFIGKRWNLTPFARGGWFFDVLYRSRCEGRGEHSAMAAAGLEAEYEFFCFNSYFGLTGSLQGLMTSTGWYGIEPSVGLRLYF